VLAAQLLRSGLLAGVSVLVVGAPEPAGSLGSAVSASCAELGACVGVCVAATAEEAAIEGIVRDAVTETGSLGLLVVDGAGLFAQGSARETKAGGEDAEGDGGVGGEDARVALSACLDAAWNVTRAVANLAFLVDEPGPTGGRVVYLTPPPDAGPHAEAARAGLENLARTLSIEWARHGITLVAIAPGEATAAGEVAALCAYLASPAGAYFSGCLLDLRGVRRGEDKEGRLSL
jgi:NAD(P)-dependent dehydrogenase (short-subunit alcohol dehydrogenase family)